MLNSTGSRIWYLNTLNISGIEYTIISAYLKIHNGYRPMGSFVYLTLFYFKTSLIYCDQDDVDREGDHQFREEKGS